MFQSDMLALMLSQCIIRMRPYESQACELIGFNRGHPGLMKSLRNTKGTYPLQNAALTLAV